MGKLGNDAIARALKKAHENQQAEAIPADQRHDNVDDAYNLILFFNIHAVDGEGHTILGLGPIGGPLSTYSYYREGDDVVAPALMACLRTPTTFEEIQESSGWIVHGEPGNYWNEHVDAALVLSCSKETYEPIHAYAEATTKNPGTYNFLTHNCLNFAEDALAQGGVKLKMHGDHPLDKVAPRDAFERACGAEGAHLYGAWKYWFPSVPAPDNGLRSIKLPKAEYEALHPKS